MKLQLTLSAIAIGMALSSSPLYAVESNPEKDVFFGTTHGHSNWSIDAFGLGNQKSGPEDGYRFARGESVSHLGGDKVQLKQPLDFFMMTDHSEWWRDSPAGIGP